MDPSLTTSQKILSYFFQIVAAVILLQSTYFKFTGAEESVWIFTTMGGEPYGRVGTAVIEIIASLLILIPPLVSFGAVLAIGVMSGAILSHLFIIGIEVLGDGGLLFGLAITTLISSLITLYINRHKLYSTLLGIDY